MTLEEFKSKYPDIAKALIDEGSKIGFDRGFKEGETKGIEKALEENQDAAKAEGARAERERIKSVKEQLIPGHEDLIEDLMFDGETSGPEAAVKILAAEKKLRNDVINDHRSDAPDIVPEPSIDQDVAAQNENLPIDEQAKIEWNKDAGIRKEFGGDYEGFLAYFEAEKKGLLKIYRGKAVQGKTVK